MKTNHAENGKHTNDPMVVAPNHYQSSKGIEVIDVIEAFTEGLQGIEAADTANAIKYICRWKDKNGIQDLEKAVWYLNHLIKHLKAPEEKPSRVCKDVYVFKEETGELVFHYPEELEPEVWDNGNGFTVAYLYAAGSDEECTCDYPANYYYGYKTKGDN